MYNDVELLFKFIFTVSLNETHGINITTGIVTKYDVVKTHVKNRIVNDEPLLHDMTMSEENNEYCIDSQENHEEEFQRNINSGYNSQIYNEICNIFEFCKNEAADNNDEGAHDNMHFNPLLGNKLKDFCKFYPI